jgi:hypothetical protein
VSTSVWGPIGTTDLLPRAEGLRLTMSRGPQCFLRCNKCSNTEIRTDDPPPGGPLSQPEPMTSSVERSGHLDRAIVTALLNLLLEQ